jgi:AraC family transcriptional regulator, 4-hydroxyphenylacetate 3-monooxygenase operon regulatory protein
VVQDTGQDWIPNIVMGKDYDRRFADAPVHYERLEVLAGFFARDMPVHRHVQYFQIHYIDAGAINFHIDDRIYQVMGPSCFLTPPSVPHSFRTEEGTTGHVLTIHQSLIWQLMEEGLQREEARSLKEGVCLEAVRYSADKRTQWDLVEQLFSNIDLEWSTEHPAKALMLENFSRLLIIQIGRQSSNRAESIKASNEALRLFRQFSDLIEENYKHHLPLPEYTARMGVSESRLNQICQKISNSSPKKLINDRLLQEIKRLLKFSNQTSKEIGYQLGFNDPAYFCRFFRRQTDMTAQQYRKLHA